MQGAPRVEGKLIAKYSFSEKMAINV